MQNSLDVIIVGAGLSGLIAAQNLTQAGLNIQILEVNNRTGGRILDFKSEYGTFSLGAEWLGPDEENLNELIKKMNLGISPQFEQGRVTINLAGHQQLFSGHQTVRVGPLPLPLESMSNNFLQTMKLLDQLCEQVPLDKPYDAKNATQWDAINVAQWCHDNIRYPKDQKLFTLIVEEEMGTSLNNISFLYYLFMRRSINKIMVDDRRITGGTQQLCDYLTTNLKGKIELNTKVNTIKQDIAGLVVRTNKNSFRSKYAIITVPPKAALEIEYLPDLTKSRRCLLQNITLAKIIKFIVIYKTPFWREFGLNGMALSDSGPIRSVFDGSPADNSCGVLVGFIKDKQAEKLSKDSLEQRSQIVISQLEKFFGNKASQVLEYTDQDWLSEKWIGGAYFPNMPPGVLTSYGKSWREPLGYIHWAGTENSQLWNGSMEGAILSGKRAATEILKREEVISTGDSCDEKTL